MVGGVIIIIIIIIMLPHRLRLHPIDQTICTIIITTIGEEEMVEEI